MSDFKRYKTIHDRDEEYRLVMLAQAGDADAMNRLVESQLNWAWLHAKRISERMNVEFDTLWSDAMLAIVHCIRGFDPSRGFRLTTYLGNTINNRALSQFVYRNRSKRKGITLSLSEEFVAGLEDYRNDSPGEHAERHELCEAVQSEIGRMSPRTADIIRRRMAGQTLEEIGIIYSITRERVRQIEGQAHFDLSKTLDRFA